MGSNSTLDQEKDWEFRVLIDDTFLNLCSDEVTPIENKNVLSISCDFEGGAWRYDKFQNFIWDNIAETSLSHRERESLAGNSHTLLVEAAKNLRFTDKELNQGSELAEIVLYGVMKRHYGALAVVPKIFYKQNSQDNAKGADSVHIVLEGANDFSIWFGEAKFYNSIEDSRLLEIVKSVGNSLKTNKLKKENSIISNVTDIDNLVTDEALREKIKAALSSRNSIDALKPKINIPILLLHECQITAVSTELSAEYIEQLKAQHIDRATSYFKKQINVLAQSIHKYSEVTFHIILLPVPDKALVVDKFLGAIEHFKGT